jgi:hypothetical protein
MRIDDGVGVIVHVAKKFCEAEEDENILGDLSKRKKKMKDVQKSFLWCVNLGLIPSHPAVTQTLRTKCERKTANVNTPTSRL